MNPTRRQRRRSKPSGNDKRSTSGKEPESPRLSQPEPGSDVEDIFDFLYVDRARIAALYAQLFPEGTLTGVKTTSQQGYSDARNLGTDIKLIKAEANTIDSGQEAIEHVFDTSWSITLEVLETLSRRSLLRTSLNGAHLGTIVLLPCFLRIIDYVSMKDLWEPVAGMFLGEDRSVQNLVGMVKGLPHTVHAHFLTRSGYIWSSLDSSYLTIPVADITLKHGGMVAGEWQVVFVLDAYPDPAPAPNFETWSAGDAANGVLTVMHGLRTHIGRPANWWGVTPLVIYRSVSGRSLLNTD